VSNPVRQRLKEIAKTRVGPWVARRQATRVDLPPSHWGLSIGPNGRLWSASVDLHELARQHGTPLHVVRGERLDRNAKDVATAADEGGEVDVFYSYKTNPVPAVLRRLHRNGIGAEVISPYELWLALRLGVPGERIIYNGPAKSADSIRTAIERDVLVINANSASEAASIARLANEQRRRVDLGIRINLPDMWGGQFGISSDSPQVVQTVKRALGDPFVDLRGLHFHRGSTMRDREVLHHYVASVLAFCDGLRAETGWHPGVLDIGGSFASPTVAAIPRREFRLNRALGADLLAPRPGDTLALRDATRLVKAMVTEHFVAHGVPVPRVVLEPGRALTTDTQLLLTTVLDVKDDGDLTHAVLDAGINVAEPVRNEYHQLFSVSAPAAPSTTPYRLVGPICTPADVLYNNWRLPRLEPGHVLAIMDTGAYFVPFSTTFSFPKPAIVMQDGPHIVTARRRETFDDLVARDPLMEPD
jgi:diaminopimelate decarboxylase